MTPRTQMTLIFSAWLTLPALHCTAPLNTDADMQTRQRVCAVHPEETLTSNELSDHEDDCPQAHTAVSNMPPTWGAWGSHLARLPLRALQFATHYPAHTLAMVCCLVPELITAAPLSSGSSGSGYAGFVCPDGHTLTLGGWLLRTVMRRFSSEHRYAAIDERLCKNEALHRTSS